jgi:hypothetical protein
VPYFLAKLVHSAVRYALHLPEQPTRSLEPLGYSACVALELLGRAAELLGEPAPLQGERVPLVVQQLSDAAPLRADLGAHVARGFGHAAFELAGHVSQAAFCAGSVVRHATLQSARRVVQAAFEARDVALEAGYVALEPARVVRRALLQPGSGVRDSARGLLGRGGVVWRVVAHRRRARGAWARGSVGGFGREENGLMWRDV